MCRRIESPKSKIQNPCDFVWPWSHHDHGRADLWLVLVARYFVCACVVCTSSARRFQRLFKIKIEFKCKFELNSALCSYGGFSIDCSSSVENSGAPLDQTVDVEAKNTPNGGKPVGASLLALFLLFCLLSRPRP